MHFIIVMIRWTGLAPWEFEFPFRGSLASTFLDRYASIITAFPTPDWDQSWHRDPKSYVILYYSQA